VASATLTAFSFWLSPTRFSSGFRRSLSHVLGLVALSLRLRDVQQASASFGPVYQFPFSHQW